MTADYFDAGFEALKSDVMKVVTPVQQVVMGAPAPGGTLAAPARPVHAARKVQQVAGELGAVLGLPLKLLNTGFALVSEPLAALVPAMPAAFLGCLYVGPPHGHTHPPSLIPPAPPIPLPSMGPILLGTSVRVLINGMPAARCGDVGMAITCCGLVPAFEVKTGSSKVFIGGARAARALDFCMECAPGSGAMNSLAKVSLAAGILGGVMGAAADLQDSSDSSDAGNAAMASAQVLSAAMTTAQQALDGAALAIKQLMGKDIAVPPIEGAIVIGSTTVLIGGFPMVNIPDPMKALFDKLKTSFSKPAPAEPEEEAEQGCKTCGT